MKMAFSPTAEIVNYEVTSGKDDLLSSLLLMQEYDHEFVQQLVSGPYIGVRIHRTAKTTLPVKLAMMLIVRGLNNRTRFAIRFEKRSF
jgi:hypothetical protein